MAYEQFGGNERASEQDTDRKKGGYGSDYFDENEQRAGQERRDLATGKPIKNDGSVQTPHGLGIDTEGKVINLKEGLSKKQLDLQNAADELLKQFNIDEQGQERLVTKRHPRDNKESA